MNKITHPARRPLSAPSTDFGPGLFRPRGAFTLIELLVVIAIIGVLAALILSALQGAVRRAKIAKAQTQITDLVSAITRYESTYSRYPSTVSTGSNDFTYAGGALVGNNPAPPSTWNINNSEVIAMLMDIEKYPANGSNTVNVGHIKNPQQVKFLNANMVGDPTLPGVGPDLIYRDPWGTPYVITMDLNYDGKCQDVFYQYHQVSQQTAGSPSGFNGLFNAADSTGASDQYQYQGGVMVWSPGPDKTVNFTNAANTDYNRDNIASWK